MTVRTDKPRTTRDGGLLPSIALDARQQKPLHTQLYLGIRTLIEQGTLEPTSQLASSRALAKDLGISRFTVTTAVAQLLSEGYLTAVAGSGTFVARELPRASTHASIVDVASAVIELRSRDPIPHLSRRGTSIEALPITGPRSNEVEPRAFRPRRPPLDIFPLSVWTRLVRAEWNRSRLSLLDYGDAAGYPPLREAIAAHSAATRGVVCTPDQVIVTNGGQQAASLIFRLLLDPGDATWLEEPGILDVRGALIDAGGTPIAVPVDADGIDVNEGTRLAPTARLAYVSPSHQYPTGATLSAARRSMLLEWARRANAWIVEDDYDSYFRYAGRPLAAVQRLDALQSGRMEAERVVYIGTFSKTMYPSLRLGYCIVPKSLVAAATNARAIADRNSPLVEQRALTEFIKLGYYDRHLRRVRKTCAHRYELIRLLLDRSVGDLMEIGSMRAGTHVVATLRPELVRELERRDARMPAAVQVANAATDAGLVVFPMERYCLVLPTRAQLVLGFGGTNDSVLTRAVDQLRTVIDQLRASVITR